MSNDLCIGHWLVVNRTILVGAAINMRFIEDLSEDTVHWLESQHMFPSLEAFPFHHHAFSYNMIALHAIQDIATFTLQGSNKNLFARDAEEVFRYFA